MAVELFYSYSHKDEDLRAELERHLSLLRRSGHISEWHDRRIEPGAAWKGEIDSHLRSARIILLLISSDFLASDYCYDIEAKLALERHQRGEAVVIPIILRPADWTAAPFAALQGLPKDAKAITTWTNRDEAFLDVARGIRQAVMILAAAGAPEPETATRPAACIRARAGADSRRGNSQTRNSGQCNRADGAHPAQRIRRPARRAASGRRARTDAGRREVTAFSHRVSARRDRPGGAGDR